VGTLQPRKNIKTLLYAFALFHKEQPDQHLVIAGKKGWMYEEIFETSRKLRVDHVVHFTGYIPEHDKINLYTHALCTVLPSFYEGFGFPLLEAFAASCPVISSETSSLPEIGGSAPLYFRPDNAQDLLNKLRLVEKDYKLCNDMIERGHTRLRQFSWETCGEDTLEVLLQ
jgi:glycosyltransferase involved in cell wall biosynthesis